MLIKRNLKSFLLKQNFILCFFLFFAGILTRIPYMSKFLYFWDSANYALGVERYNVFQWRPNPPGYFIYIFFTKFFNLFLSDINLCLVSVNVLSTGIAVVMIFLFTKELFDFKIAIASSLIFLSSPVVWFHGETALTYMFDGAIIMVFIYLCYKSFKTPILLYAVLAGVFLGVSAGIRQQNSVLLFPVFLYCLHKQNIKNIVLSFLCFGAVCFAWFIPMIELSGGLKSYIEACRQQGGSLTHETFAEYIKYFQKVCGKTIKGLAKAITIGLIPLSIYFILNFKKILKNKKTIFFFLWIIPCFVFWFAFHLGNVGHMFTCLFAVFPVLGFAIYKLSQKFEYKKEVFEILTAVCILVNICVFFFDAHPERSFKEKTWFKEEDVRKRSDLMEQKINYIKNNFNKEDTIIFANTGGNGHLAQASYYLRGYRLYHFNSIDNTDNNTLMFTKGYGYVQKKELQGDFVIPKGVKNIILFDNFYFKHLKDKNIAQTVELEKNVEIQVISAKYKKVKIRDNFIVFT
jgi:hypothetical protein